MKIILFSCLISYLFSSLLLGEKSQAQQVYGLFMIVKGDVTFQNPNAPIEKAKVGAKVFEGSLIISNKDSRAKIVMSDRNVLNLSPDSKLLIQKYDSSVAKKNVSLSLQQGKVRVNVEQKYDGTRQKFLLKTPTVVAGVRGTQFLATYDLASQTSQIVTFKGVVSMTSFSTDGKPISTVTIEKGQTSSAAPNQPPAQPQTIPKEEIKDLDRSTASAGSDTQNKKDVKNEPKITTTQDLETDLARDIKVVAEGAKNALPQTAPPAPVVNLPQTAPVKDFIRDAIQNQNSKTKVIINVR